MVMKIIILKRASQPIKKRSKDKEFGRKVVK